MNIHPIRLLALGSALLVALCSEASAAALDADFGHDGRVAVELGVYGSRANAVIVQPDGKIVAAGSSSSTAADKDFMLFRLLPDGSIDSAFNSDGTVTTAVGPFDDEALTLALQPDGKILAAGYSSSDKNRDFALVRYNSDGKLDRSFGTEGMAVTAVGSSHDEITDVIVQEDGSIVIAGVAQGVNGRVVVLGRYLANGTPDLSFAKEGFSLSVVGVDAQAESVALTESGRILVSGSYSDGQRRGLMVLGFDATGQLDKEFGENGIAIPTDSSVFSEGYGMFVNKDGGILVAGSVGKENTRDAALFRFTAEGHPNSDLGVLVTAVGTQDDVLYDVVVTDETIVAAGFKTVDQQRDFLLITYSKDTGAAQENSAQFTTSAVVTTGFSGGKDTSTALAAVSENSVVAVGESEAAAGSSAAAVSKYTTAIAANSSTTANNVLGINTLTNVNTGNQYILTGTPYELTRTTVIIPAEVLNGLSNVTQRGLVFGTMPNPVLTSSESSSSSSSSNSNTSNNAPVMSNLSPSNGTIGTAYATLSLSTDVNATCKYDITPNKAYDQMASAFATTGAKEHSHSVTGLQNGDEKKYYVRCKNTSSNAMNTTDGVISFKVDIGSSSTTDTTPPVVTETTKATFSEDGIVSLSVSTNEKAMCRYSNDETDGYDAMTKSFSVSADGRNHSVVLGKQEEGTHVYYARCKDNAGNKNTSGTKIQFTVQAGNDTGPERSGLEPSGNILTASPTLKVSTDVAATCKYNTAPETEYSDMVNNFTAAADGKTHSAGLSGLSAEEHTYYVRCKNKSTGAANTTDEEISFNVNLNTPPPPAAYSAPDRIINTALRNIGSFFIGTAVAQTSTTDTATTSNSSSSPSSNSTTSETKFLEEGNTSAGSGSGAFSSKLKNLKPGTFFYARAYAVSGGTTYYGNQVSFRTADSCFIATAAFGSVFDPSVQILRDFRDQFMSGNAVSRFLINFYYQHSPSIADVISQHNTLRLAVRILLLPVIGVAWIALHIGLSELFFLVIVGFALLLCSQYALRLLRRRSKAVSI